MASIDIVAPVFNESEGIADFIGVIQKNLLDEEGFRRLILVDDGSTDQTWEIIHAAAIDDSRIKLIRLTKNYGHQRALLAGLRNSDAEFLAIIDSDLQDDPRLLPDMYALLCREKAEIVYGHRISRAGESLFKRSTASVFYRLLNSITKIEIPLDAGDFRIVTRKAVKHLLELNEVHPFIRGQFALLGLKSLPYEYARHPRLHGQTKYTLKKMVKLAMNATLTLSDLPLKIGVRLGLSGLLFSSLVFVFAMYNLLFNQAVSGWTSLFFLVSFFGSINLVLISLISHYLLTIWNNSVNFPKYVISEQVN